MDSREVGEKVKTKVEAGSTLTNLQMAKWTKAPRLALVMM
jgi:hypothetical protein